MSYDLQGTCILLHGPPKVGKTALASSFPLTQFIATERGHNFIPEFQKNALIRIKNWMDFENLNKKFPQNVFTKDGKNVNAKTIVLDTVTSLYHKCFLHVCNEEKCTHPSKKGEYGRAIWNMIGNLFGDELDKFVNNCVSLQATLILIDHSKEVELEVGALTVSKLIVSFSEQTRRWVTPIPDHIWYLGYGVTNLNVKGAIQNFMDERMLVIRGGELIEASTRDTKITTKTICPLIEANRSTKTGGYYQIVQELSTKETKD